MIAIFSIIGLVLFVWNIVLDARLSGCRKALEREREARGKSETFIARINGRLQKVEKELRDIKPLTERDAGEL